MMMGTSSIRVTGVLSGLAPDSKGGYEAAATITSVTVDGSSIDDDMTLLYVTGINRATARIPMFLDVYGSGSSRTLMITLDNLDPPQGITDPALSMIYTMGDDPYHL
jgi:hypothetical protein